MNLFTYFNHTRRSHRLFNALLGIFFLLVCLPAKANTSAKEIIDKANEFLEQQVELYQQTSSINGRYQINLGRLDSRLRMNPCSRELDAKLENNSTPVGRVTVRISCNDNSPWSIYVPANISLFREVVVVARPIKRNALIQQNDILLAERDLASLNQGYFTELEQVIDSQARRALQTDQAITPSQIQAPPLVKRGEQVVINALSGSINVRMPGEALSDGALGQQIRVRNTSSQKIIYARVVGPGQVEVAM